MPPVLRGRRRPSSYGNTGTPNRNEDLTRDEFHRLAMGFGYGKALEDRVEPSDAVMLLLYGYTRHAAVLVGTARPVITNGAFETRINSIPGPRGDNNHVIVLQDFNIEERFFRSGVDIEYRHSYAFTQSRVGYIRDLLHTRQNHFYWDIREFRVATEDVLDDNTFLGRNQLSTTATPTPSRVPRNIPDTPRTTPRDNPNTPAASRSNT